MQQEHKEFKLPIPFARGGNADLFQVANARVLKAFRRKSYVVTAPVDWNDHDAITRVTFRAEARAYERLQQHPHLERYTPAYFGIAYPHRVLAALPEANARYVGGCGLLLEYIAGVAIKLSALEKELRRQVATVLIRFRDDVGISSIWDASCFIPGSRALFTVIDFSTWDSADYQATLYEAGRLSPQQRLLLEQEAAEGREGYG